MNQELLNEFKRNFLNILSSPALNESLSFEKVSGDEMDMATEGRDTSILLKLAGRRAIFFKKVKAALKRIEDNTFGDCVECDEEIGIERLRARPTTLYCIACKEELERNERDIAYRKRSHTCGKEIINNNSDAGENMESTRPVENANSFLKLIQS